MSLNNMDSIDLSVRSKTLVALVGQVGAGKSSLISALLGEMEKRGGHVSTKVSDNLLVSKFSNIFINKSSACV